MKKIPQLHRSWTCNGKVWIPSASTIRVGKKESPFLSAGCYTMVLRAEFTIVRSFNFFFVQHFSIFLPWVRLHCLEFHNQHLAADFEFVVERFVTAVSFAKQTQHSGSSKLFLEQSMVSFITMFLLFSTAEQTAGNLCSERSITIFVTLVTIPFPLFHFLTSCTIAILFFC